MSVIKLSESNFAAEALAADKPVLVDFWAGWCAPCRMVSPLVDEIATELEGKIKVGKVDVTEAPELAQSYDITNIPALLLFRDGAVAASVVGAMPKAEILRRLGLDNM
ncbi:MAG: thioredoxin [Peptococcaceae bacterium]|jgi:thioredoxin 1|nr:thioredoxin [Peptococcaceae bacterium]